MPSQNASLSKPDKMTVSAKEAAVKRSKPTKISTSDSTTTVPTKPRRKHITRVIGSSSVIAHRKVTRTTSKTGAQRLGATNSLLGKDHAGFDECTPILLHPRALLELSPRFPRRVPHEDANNYNSLTDQINPSLSYAALCSREPGASLSRTQLAPSQSTIPASAGFRLGQMSLGNSHSPVGVDHVQSTQRAPRSSTSNLDIEGWPVSSTESSPSKHHKASIPIRMHRPLDFEHMLPSWTQGHEWDQRPDIRSDLQEDVMAATSARANLGASLGVNLGGVGSGVVTVGNSANSMPPSACHHHFPRTTLCDQEGQFFYPESSAFNIDWDTPKPQMPQIPRTPSFNTFPRNYSSLQVLPQRSYHQSASPQAQESYLSTSPNTITSSGRSGFSCNQQPSSNFTSTYSCTTPTCCGQAPSTCCTQGPPTTPTNGMRTSASVANQQQPSSRGHAHCGACNCGTMHHNRTPTNEPHYHQYNPPNPLGPVSASGSNTSANMNVQMHNNAALRRAVRPPRTMLINAAAAGTHITNSRGRSASRQTALGRRPVRMEHPTSYGRLHHCRRMSIADCPHRLSYRAHTCLLNHYNAPSR